MFIAIVDVPFSGPIVDVPFSGQFWSKCYDGRHETFGNQQGIAENRSRKRQRTQGVDQATARPAEKLPPFQGFPGTGLAGTPSPPSRVREKTPCPQVQKACQECRENALTGSAHYLHAGGTFGGLTNAS